VLLALGLRRRKTLRLDGTEAIKQAVACGLGLAFVSRAALADQLALQRIAILPVDGLVIRRTFSRLRLRGRAAGISPASRELELLLDEASDGAVSSDATGVSDLPSDI
jgi:DNA-binding transcriptional LysR family regulator